MESFAIHLQPLFSYPSTNVKLLPVRVTQIQHLDTFL